MDSQKTPFTVQLGQGASIRFGGTHINTGMEGATIRFGNIEAPLDAPTYGPTARGRPEERPCRTETTARRAHLPVQPARIAESAAAEVPRRKTSVFERLGRPEAQVMKRIAAGGRIPPISANAVHRLAESFVAGKDDAEASSSGGKLSKKQRRKLNGRLRAQHVPLESSVIQQSSESLANIPTQNKFANLRWVKRNDSKGELKPSF